jgi:hypothetical protein
LVATLLITSVFSQSSFADPPQDLGAQLQAQLAAGEFGPALATAKQVPADAGRDQFLAQIAAAQYEAGARTASLNTIGRMSNDLERGQVLAAFAPGGFGSDLTQTKPGQGKPGGNGADFDDLINLITSTIAPSTWDSAGGPGAIQSFPGGVYVDAEGVLRPALGEDHSRGLAALRRAAAAGSAVGGAHQHAALRKVSLPRLERAIQLRIAAGQQPTDEMRVLAGLERVKYVLIYPQTHDLVLAGPADDWQMEPEGRLVAKTSGHPVLRLDDLVVILRHMLGSRDARFGCSITPTEAGLAATQEFLAQSNRTPLKPGAEAREAWLKQLRAHLGRQTVTVDGIDPRTHVGRVIVEADYRMKLVGLGLEDGVLGVPSYLSMIDVPKGAAPPPLDVLRWWFTLNYSAVQSTADRDGFEIRGQGVKVLSENELLSATGQQVHTGESEMLNRDFARNFTQHFPELAAKYPVYSDLQNVFDLALVGAVIRSEKLTDRVDWHVQCFGDPRQFAVELGAAAKSVESVMNHRVVNRVNILVGVSGGVSCDPAKLVEPKAIEADYGRLREELAAAGPKTASPDTWWWD